MGKVEKTHVVMLLDESGSMSPHKRSVIDSFNGYVKELRNSTKRCYLSLFKFDERTGAPLLREVFTNRKVKECYPLGDSQYEPHGATPLYDAVGQLIKATKKRLSKSAKVLFVIHTDGQENASREFNQERIKSMIRKCEQKRGWTFIYLGEGAQAWNAGYDFGIQNVSNYSPELRDSSMAKLATVTSYVTSNSKADVMASSHTLYRSAGVVNPDDISDSEVPHVTSTVQTDKADEATSDNS